MTGSNAIRTGVPVPLPHRPAWANRDTLAPMTNKQSHDDGRLSDTEYASKRTLVLERL